MKTFAPTARLFLGIAGSALACGGTPAEPINTNLVGLWELVDYHVGTRMTTPSGTWVFFDDGFMAMDLKFEFADGPPGYLAGTGSFQQINNGVILDFRRSRTTWAAEFTASEVTLRKTVPAETGHHMTLVRYSSSSHSVSKLR